MTSTDILNYARRLKTMAHLGLTYAGNEYEVERYKELEQISLEMQILLVKEKADGKWSLPGGWADIGLSPTEVAVKEVLEETGFTVKPKKLLAILDKRCHPHPPQLDYVYKIFIHCEVIGGTQTAAFDILDTGFFAQNAIPELSSDRVLPSQIESMFEYLNYPKKAAIVD